MLSLKFLSMLVGKHLVNNWPFDPSAPLSTFRTKWPLNGDVPAGMDVSRLVVQLFAPAPTHLNNRGPPVNHGDVLGGICSSFK